MPYFYNGADWVQTAAGIGFTDLSSVVVDEDDMSSDSDTKIPTEQSVKSYVDTKVSAIPGTVTTISVASVNGFSGTVSNPTTTPVISVKTSIVGLLKGDGTAISRATSGTDYAPATSGSSLLYGNGSGGFSAATVSTGLSFTSGVLAVGTTVATLTGAQTLTSKTLTSPVISTIVNTGTLTLPTSTDTLVGRATTDTLTNKTLTDSSNVFPTLNQNTTGTAAGLTGKTTPTGTLVGTTDAQTLTSKTLAYGSNTITGLPYDLSFISFGAATTRATGTGDNPMGIMLQRAVTLTSVTFRCNTADASGSMTVNLQRNGTLITGTSTTIAAASQVGGATTTFSQACSAGDIILANITAVGTTPGTGLVVDITGSF